MANPGRFTLYIALTRINAKNILWTALKQLNDSHKLGIEFREAELKAMFPNKAEMWLVGADSAMMAERLRGVRFEAIVIDEAASFRSNLQYLIDDVLTPTLIDSNGSLIMIGTPSAACLGPFYDATTKADSPYSVHKWNILKNVHIPHATRWLEDYRMKKGWSENHPTYLREWLGQWVKSEDSLVFRLSAERNRVKQAPEGLYHVIGVDLGYVDAFAVSVVGFKYEEPNAYVVDCFRRSGMTITEFAEVIKTYRDLYNPVSMVADTGGLGKAIVVELTSRFGLTLKPAEKRDKFGIVELVNGDLISGRILFLEEQTKKLWNEMEVMQWDEDRLKLDERCQQDCTDSFLYAFRESKHYTFEPKVDLSPDHEIVEYWDRKALEIEAEDADRGWL